MNKVLYLHIGPHKTGTTYIQKYLFLNRDYLENHGIFYPVPRCLEESVGHYGHHDIKKYVEEYISVDYEKILLSSETISSFSKEEINHLLNRIYKNGVKEIKLIVYVRNPLDRLKSYYVERVKWGEIRKFSDFAIEHLSKPFQSDILNIVRILEKFTDYIGKENIILIDYDFFSKKDSIIKPLLEVLDLPYSKFFIKSEKINKSLDFILTEFLRILNMLAHIEGILRSNNIRTVFLKLLKEKEEKFIDKISLLKDKAESYKYTLVIGDYLASVLRKKFLEKFKDNLYNETLEDWSNSMEITLISDEFLLENINTLRSIYEIIKKELEASA